MNKDEFEIDNLNVLSCEDVSVLNAFVSELCVHWWGDISWQYLQMKYFTFIYHCTFTTLI